jgi:hypothetical protein
MAAPTHNKSPTSASSYHLPNISEGGMSSHSIASTLAAHPSIPEETMCEITARLLHTIELCKDAHKQAIWALNEKVLHLEELIGNDNDKAPNMPEGYIKNKGKIPGFDIHVGNRMYLPAK